MFYLSWDSLWKASFPATPNDLLSFKHDYHYDEQAPKQADMGATAGSQFSTWYSQFIRINGPDDMNVVFTTLLSWEEWVNSPRASATPLSHAVLSEGDFVTL